MKNKLTKIPAIVLLAIYGVFLLIFVFSWSFLSIVLFSLVDNNDFGSDFSMSGDFAPLIIVWIIYGCESIFQVSCMILMLVIDHNKFWEKRSRAITFLVFNFIFSIPFIIYFVLSGTMLAEYIKFRNENNSSEQPVAEPTIAVSN